MVEILIRSRKQVAEVGPRKLLYSTLLRNLDEYIYILRLVVVLDEKEKKKKTRAQHAFSTCVQHCI